ncbi:MAG TPA: hypothetical protein VIN10_02700 [Bacteroidales bacterium]
MLQLSEINNAYVFIRTKDEKKIQRVNRLTSGLKFMQLDSSNQENYINGIFYRNIYPAGNNTFYGIEKVNDLGDYDLGAFQFSGTHKLNNHFDSIISYCFFQENNFIAGTDYLSIFNHFYFYDNDTFICSNNLFIVAKLCDESISEEAIFETLFFRFPYRNITFFKSIKSLNPFQQLCFNEEKGLCISNSVTYCDLMLEDNVDISTAIESFFSNLKNPENLPAALSFSGGSDSTALLAILKNRNIDCQLASFKGHNNWDTHRIKKLSEKLKCSFIYVDPTYAVFSEDNELQYTFLTNGNHTDYKFFDFYSRLPEKYILFDGYSMMLGDMSDATLYPPFKDVLQGLPIDLVFEKYFAGFDPLFLKRMKDYLICYYEDRFLNINTREGLHNMQQYCVEGVMSKVYAGVLKCPLYFGHQNVSFYLSRKYISLIEKNGYGISKTCSGRDDYQGYFYTRKPLSEIAHKMNKMVYELKLDQGFSFKDIHENTPFKFLKKKMKTIDRKVFEIQHRKVQLNFQKNELDLNDYDFVKQKSELNKYAFDGLKLLRYVSNVNEKIGN